MTAADVVAGGGRVSVPAGAFTTPAAGGGLIVEGDAVAVTVTDPVSRYYRHGWHSFSPARWVDAAAPVTRPGSWRLQIGGDDPAYLRRRVPGGSGVGAVEAAPGAPVTLLGALGPGARVEWRDGVLHGESEDPAGRWYVACGAHDDVFAEYASLLGAALGTRRRPAPRAWMSWYGLYDDIDEPVLHAVLDDLRGLDFDAFVVDDGWARGIGDWRANERFPAGLPALAGVIRDAGMTPGLWCAPFIARPGAPVLAEHPDWFVADETGGPAVAGDNWGGPYHGLDLTHPDALAHVRDTVAGFVAAGFGLLKLDFLFGGAIPGRRRRAVPRETAYREGVRAIRDAAGETTYLLACGAPIIASLGIFDAIRIGPDVAGWWENPLAADLHVATEPATRDAIATSANRLWLAPVIGLDPDVAYFRARAQMLTRAQQRDLQDLARICGTLATSDPPQWLDADERAALSEFLAHPATVQRQGRHRFLVDGRRVDLSAIAELPLP